MRYPARFKQGNHPLRKPSGHSGVDLEKGSFGNAEISEISDCLRQQARFAAAALRKPPDAVRRSKAECDRVVRRSHILLPLSPPERLADLLHSKRAILNFNQGHIVLCTISGMDSSLCVMLQRQLEFIPPAGPAVRSQRLPDSARLDQFSPHQKGFQLSLLPFQFRFIRDMRIGTSRARIRTAGGNPQRRFIQNTLQTPFGI